MYSVSSYGRMIADESRLAAYVAAMRRTIRPNSVVVDIGTGPGLFALVACQLGARRVYAIEPDNIIQVARETATANGLDRIEFIQNVSTEVTLPERADVIVSDLRGVLPWFQGHLSSIIDARTRLLAPEGILIGASDSLWAAPVAVPETYEKLVAPWNQSKYELQFLPALTLVTNAWIKTHVKRDELLGDPVCWHTLDYSRVQESDVQATISMHTSKLGTAHGFAVWFDAELSEKISFSNAPGNVTSIYGNAFFPFTQPINVKPGTRIDVNLRADLVQEDYVWQWAATIMDPESGCITKSFRQSTLSGTVLSPSTLQKRSSTYVPSMTDKGLVDHFILGKIDGKTSLEEIARQLVDRFPERFLTVSCALDAVADVTLQYGK